MDLDLIDDFSDAADSSSKKVDKLGRVRPSTYSSTKEKPRKLKCYGLESSVSESVVDDFDELHEEQQGESVDIANNRDLDNEIPVVNTYSKDEIFGICNQMFDDTDSFEIIDPDNDNLISDEKWYEMMNFPGIFDEEKAAGPEDQDNVICNKDATIYHGHQMTVCTSMILILLYSISHNISGSQLSDLLTLIGYHCLKTHPGLKSIYKFKRFFADINSPLKKHYYCAFCMTSVNEKDEKCTNEKCQRKLSEKKSRGNFIEIPVEHQLRKLLEKDGFVELLQQRFTRKKENQGSIEDIYDGKLYQKFSQDGGPLSKHFPFNVSFTWNTDGIPIFKSSKFSIWPLYLTINELPPKYRMHKENMLLYGIWFGESKPFMSSFTKPLMNTLRKLETDGVEFEKNNKKFCSKGFLICGTADLPAKSLVLNCNQFNGEHSCMKCLDSGCNFRTEKGGSVRIFPYDSSMQLSDIERTSQGCVKDAFLAIENKKVVNGIKGPSFLMTLMCYDFVKSTSIDYMHGVLLGVTKLLINLWIGSVHSKETFSVSTYVNIIDQRLTKIKPPSFISRIPRTLSDHFKYWKASELRSWLFFYSLPILSDILSPNYFMHYACFVEGIYLLCKDCILPEDIRKSGFLLSYFVHMFPSLYGKRYLTLNMHSLLHLPGCVEDLGPLWVYSCFAFEDANGTLTKLFHGTQNIEMQIISSVNIIQNMSSMLQNITDATYISFAEKLHRKSVGDKIQIGTSSRSFPVGSDIHMTLSKEKYAELINEVKFMPTNVYFFKRISHRGILIHSSDYSRVQVRNTYTVKYFESKTRKLCFGSVIYFILAKKCQCKEVLCFCSSTLAAVLKKYEEVKSSILEPNFLHVQVPHIKITKETESICIVDIAKIISVLVNVSFDNNSGFIYLCDVPNVTESD